MFANRLLAFIFFANAEPIPITLFPFPLFFLSLNYALLSGTAPKGKRKEGKSRKGLLSPYTSGIKPHERA